MHCFPRFKWGYLWPKKSPISIIKCDVGSLAGHHVVPKPLFDIAEKNLKKAVNEGIINNF